MKTFNNLSPLESSIARCSIAVDHNLNLLSTVLRSAVRSSSKDPRRIALLTETLFEQVDNFIMDNFGYFNEQFFIRYKNEIHCQYENEIENNSCEDA